jgi:hypothetical protein
VELQPKKPVATAPAKTLPKPAADADKGAKAEKPDKAPKTPKAAKDKDEAPTAGAEVVSLDAFRKKN